MIAQLTWNQLQEETIYWLCSDYDVCVSEDFKTLSALPDLLKHEKKFIKYFDLHFYNNLADDPPNYCRIKVDEAITQKQPNLLKAVKRLMSKFISVNDEKLSFTELAYFIHLLADLHQPFHRKNKKIIVILVNFYNNLVTDYDRGGINRKLCDKNLGTCWSLHALWDAEILKLVNENKMFSFLDSEDNISFEVKDWAMELNQYICKIYDYPDSFGIEEYVDKFKLTALFLVGKAANNTAAVLNSNFKTPRQNLENDF